MNETFSLFINEEEELIKNQINASFLYLPKSEVKKKLHRNINIPSYKKKK